VELTALEPVLLVKTAETAKLLQQLAVEQAEVERVQARVEVEESTVKRQAEAVAELQADALAAVEAALPVLDGAIRALDALDKKVRGGGVGEELARSFLLRGRGERVGLPPLHRALLMLAPLVGPPPPSFYSRVTPTPTVPNLSVQRACRTSPRCALSRIRLWQCAR
jgi:hypothetical protein